MPRISFFYGIAITMYFYDHEPPPMRALKLVAEWADLHRGELEADWVRAKSGDTPEPIDPLP